MLLAVKLVLILSSFVNLQDGKVLLSEMQIQVSSNMIGSVIASMQEHQQLR